MNTAVRLLFQVPAAILMTLIAILGIGFGGFNLPTLAIAAVMIGLPMWSIIWTIKDHRRRLIEMRNL